MELVTSLWRPDRLRGLELAVLSAATEEGPPSEATVRKLRTFVRYGARIDKDMAKALYALSVLRDRPDERVAELRNDTSEPSDRDMLMRNFTNELSPCTLEPEPANGNIESCTAEPGPPARNRLERRRLVALARKRRAAQRPDETRAVVSGPTCRATLGGRGDGGCVASAASRIGSVAGIGQPIVIQNLWRIQSADRGTGRWNWEIEAHEACRLE